MTFWMRGRTSAPRLNGQHMGAAVAADRQNSQRGSTSIRTASLSCFFIHFTFEPCRTGRAAAFSHRLAVWKATWVGSRPPTMAVRKENFLRCRRQIWLKVKVDQKFDGPGKLGRGGWLTLTLQDDGGGCGVKLPTPHSPPTGLRNSLVGPHLKNRCPLRKKTRQLPCHSAARDLL